MKLYKFEQIIKVLKEFDERTEKVAKKYDSNKLIFWVDGILAFLLYGANPKDYFRYDFYRLNRRGRNEFFTMRKLDKMVRKFNNREQIYIFNSKVDFNRTFSQYIARRWIYVPESDDKQIESFIKMHKEIIVKPNSLSSGRGIYKIHINAINNLKEFINNLRVDNCLIEEIIIQHEKMKELNSVAVNTIRAYTFIDESGKPHIIATTLRVAGDANSCTDNLHSGGIVASIDLESGVCFTMATNMNFEKFVCHPVTKTIIPGFQVPFWDDVKELLFNAALIVPTVRYVGWDVAITPDGPILIEGNHDANHDVMQIADQTGKYRKIMDLLQE